jgi:hypothetical protein
VRITTLLVVASFALLVAAGTSALWALWTFRGEGTLGFVIRTALTWVTLSCFETVAVKPAMLLLLRRRNRAANKAVPYGDDWFVG